MPEDRNLGKRCSVVQFIFFYTIAVLAIGLALLVTMALTGCQHKDNASSSKITAEMAILREYTIFSSSMLYAVIKGRHEYERYDFSDELKYDEEMWEIVKGKFVSKKNLLLANRMLLLSNKRLLLYKKSHF